jgi:hypothetical protein
MIGPQTLVPPPRATRRARAVPTPPAASGEWTPPPARNRPAAPVAVPAPAVPAAVLATCWAKTDGTGVVLSYGRLQPAIFYETIRRIGAVAVTPAQHDQLRGGGRHRLLNGALTKVEK